MLAKNSLPRRESLKQNRDIRKLLKYGKRLSAEGVSFVWERSDTFGYILILTKKHGNAVQRNQIKRILREAIRRHKQRLLQPINLAVFPETSAVKPDFRIMDAEISQTIERINGIVSE